MTMRLRRLSSDYGSVTALFESHPYVRIISADGDPPEKYTIEYHVTGLSPRDDGELETRFVHRAEVYLPVDYPRRAPICRMITPVFHPNIDPAKICIGDHWSAGQLLAHLIVRIAEMICYQSYNVKSPLNAKAAVWAEENTDKLPLERADLSSGL